MNRRKDSLETLLWASLALFALGAISGAIFRWAMVMEAPWGWSLSNLRHGHSHIMLMGWATPALMVLMARAWEGQGARSLSRAVGWAGWSSWGFALASFPAFLWYGYESVPIGGATLPLAAILSGMAIFCWYGFAVIYGVATWRIEKRSPALRLWDLAVGALVVSSIGAWAVAGLMIAGIDDPLYEAATVHFFVDLFGGGWLVLGVIGLLRARVQVGDSAVERVGRLMVGVGLPFIFLVGLPRAHAPEWWPLMGSAAAGIAVGGWALILRSLWRCKQRWIWRVVVLLMLKVAMLAAVAVPPLADWGLRSGLRIFYLHIALVGVVSLGLAVEASCRYGRDAMGRQWVWLGIVGLLLITMLPLTGLWPSPLGGLWVYWLSFVGALGASLLALGATWWSALRPYRGKNREIRDGTSGGSV